MEGAVGRGGRCDRHHGLQASIRPKFGMYSLKSSVGSRQYRNGGVIPMQCARPLLSARNKRAGDCNKEGRTPLWRLSKSSSKRYSRTAVVFPARSSLRDDESQTCTNPKPAARDTSLYDPKYEKSSCGVGFVANLNKKPTHDTVEKAVKMLKRMSHRGACGNEENSGDGAGILVNIPDEFFRKELKETANIDLPPVRNYAVAAFFLDKDEKKQSQAKEIIESVLFSKKYKALYWREVATDDSELGSSSKRTAPAVVQLFIECSLDDDQEESSQREKELYKLKKAIENTLRSAGIEEEHAYLVSLSNRTVVYKGQLTPEQIDQFYPELKDESFRSYVALVHSRFSTNTVPSWARAQPNSVLGHNGEINTLEGNKNWMKAREGVMKCEDLKLAPDEVENFHPVIPDGQSDSGALNCALELLSHCGRSLPEAILMMIPEAWQSNTLMSDERRAFYEFHSAVMEPWDGPAMVTFTDGDCIGATLDRNGLRPGRYYVTKDDQVILASEVGVVDVDPEDVIYKGRLQPGNIFLIDFDKNRIIQDEEVKGHFAKARPYGEWLSKFRIRLEDIAKPATQVEPGHSNLDSNSSSKQITSFEDLICPLTTFGYTMESVEMILQPMALKGSDPLGSMGNDSALACLSKKPKLAYDYLKQMFAQVTNPPIDPIREACVTSLECFIGPEYSVTETFEEQAKRISVSSPIISSDTMASIKANANPEWKTAVLDATFSSENGKENLRQALSRLSDEASAAIEAGCKLIVISDRKQSPERAPITSILACGAVHHHLIEKKQRTRVGILIESGDAWEVHHFCTLIGFGADVVCPYLALSTIENLPVLASMNGTRPSNDHLRRQYIHAVETGMLKVMSKMGISTLASYKGAQIFEAVGLGKDVIEECFRGTVSRVGGVNLETLESDILALHREGYSSQSLVNPGDFHFRSNPNSSVHLNDPMAISKLQEAVRLKSTTAYKIYSETTNELNKACTLRGLFKFKNDKKQVPISEVESSSEIVKRFVTGAMSYGSISLEAHTTLAKAMNTIGGKSNSGEGGENPRRLEKMQDGSDNIERSAIKQVASGRFGVTAYYLTNADQIQIKIAQGAKPGEGGELPGHKVVGDIAKTRGSTPRVGLTSPPPHHDIYSIEDLAQLIFDLKNSNPSASVSVKLVSEFGVGVIAAGVTKGHADHIVVSGHDGGTGAAKWTGIKHAGLPWELGVAETHQTLVANELRGRVKLQTDGQLKTGRDVVIACLLGAEEFAFSTAPLISMGCIMMRKCHTNTCPVGIATQDPELRAKFRGQPDHVINYFFMVAEEVREYMADLGFRKLDEMVGRADVLEIDTDVMQSNQKASTLDLSSLLYSSANLSPESSQVKVEAQHHKLEETLDHQVLVPRYMEMQKKIDAGEPVVIKTSINNRNRAVGTTLSHHITREYGMQGLSDDMITVQFHGSAGQSFGAFACRGLKMVLEGDCNDYVGKGLSGATLIVHPPANKVYAGGDPRGNIIVGNAVLYGATSGKAFFCGAASERFAVRNSGAEAVVESVGDHGCEYMTGGTVVILGTTGHNFAAGMSGGIAYVYDPCGDFKGKCNMDLIELEGHKDWRDHEACVLENLIREHATATNSARAREILSDWVTEKVKFVRVMPRDYKNALRLLENEKTDQSSGLESEKALLQHDAADGQIVQGRSLKWHSDRPQVVSDNADKTRGFLLYNRGSLPQRTEAERLSDWKEIANGDKITDSQSPKHDILHTQSARCMECGTPFCHSRETDGCPLTNKIPEFNALVHQGRWEDALHRLLETNNFPEFTGRVCPAPCEGSCVLGIIDMPVSIKNIECSIIDMGFEKGWIKPSPPEVRSGKKVAIIGSGPAGMAAADQLNKKGHSVTVYERADRIGGLMMYGVPNMKADKLNIVQRRVDLMEAEGVSFVTNAHVGVNVQFETVRAENDAVLLACGSTRPRDLKIEGRDAAGIHFAMDFLTANTKSLLDSNMADNKYISAKDKRVIVVGGGDTGTDCIATVLRHKCKSVINFELLPQPAAKRESDTNPWPQWPSVFRVDYGHAEAHYLQGKDPRRYSVLTKRFVKSPEGNLIGVETVQVEWKMDDALGKRSWTEVPGTESLIEADMVLLALGFLGPEDTISKIANVKLDPKSNFEATPGDFRTSVDGIFAAGDCRRGQSLVVWAIAEGREAAESVDRYISDLDKDELTATTMGFMPSPLLLPPSSRSQDDKRKKPIATAENDTA